MKNYPVRISGRFTFFGLPVFGLTVICAVSFGCVSGRCYGQTESESTSDLDPKLREAENQRIQTIAQATQATVCVFSADGQSGGSGVLIDPAGFALSNFHVVDPCGRHMLCGLKDGKIYDAVLVGIDPVGDLALIKLMGRKNFPFATFGNSDQVKPGQECFAAGNPFLLANDFQPSVTWGIVSGIHRYQYPSGTLLEYADCIQTDAAINPGNSGGPLFDKKGKLIGINGRGSFEKRGRVNVGVGYAISINQVKNFVGCLRSGRITDHASMGFVVSKGEGDSVRVSEISTHSDAYRQGIRYDAEILEVAHRKTLTANALKNIVGTFPPGWSVPVKFRMANEVYDVMVRLESVHAESDLLAKVSTMNLFKSDTTKRLSEKVQQQIESRRGYGNFYFNRLETQRCLSLLDRHYNPNKSSHQKVVYQGKTRLDAVQLVYNRGRSGFKIGNELGAIEADIPFENQTVPRRSGGFLNALHIFHEVVLEQRKSLGITYWGKSPFASPLESKPSSRWNPNELYDVLRILRNGTESKFYLDSNGRLKAIEYFDFPESPPCVVEFSGRLESDSAPLDFARIVSSYNGQTYADISLTKAVVDVSKAKDPLVDSPESTRRSQK